MKRLVLLFVLVVFVNSVFAGNVMNVDFTDQLGHKILFQEGEGVRFDFEGMDNKIIVKEIRSERKQVDITVFIEGAEVPLYQTLHSDFKIDLDFNRDDVDDMEIRLDSFKENNTVVLLITSLSSFEMDKEGENEGMFGDFSWNLESLKNYSKTYMLYIVLGVLVLLLLVVERRTILRSFRRIKRGFRI